MSEEEGLFLIMRVHIAAEEHPEYLAHVYGLKSSRACSGLVKAVFTKSRNHARPMTAWYGKKFMESGLLSQDDFHILSLVPAPPQPNRNRDGIVSIRSMSNDLTNWRWR